MIRVLLMHMVLSQGSLALRGNGLLNARAAISGLQ